MTVKATKTTNATASAVAQLPSPRNSRKPRNPPLTRLSSTSVAYLLAASEAKLDADLRGSLRIPVAGGTATLLDAERRLHRRVQTADVGELAFAGSFVLEGPVWRDL